MKNKLDYILKNRNKIKFIKEIYEDTGSYYLFKIYFHKKNILDFCNYLRIISWDTPSDYAGKKSLDISIEIPTWNIFKCIDRIDIESLELSKILKDIHIKALRDENNKILMKINNVIQKRRK